MSNQRLTRQLTALLHQQAREFAASFTAEAIARGDKADLSPWIEQQRRAIMPYLVVQWQLGVAQAVQDLVRFGVRGTRPSVRAVRVRLWRECRETLELALNEASERIEGEIDAKVRQLRRLMARGKIDGSEARRHLRHFAREAIVGRNRAAVLAEDQSRRAVMGGRMLLVQETGVSKRKRWDAEGPNPCKVCARLHGKVVALNEPFWVDPKGGPWAVKDTPPLHPHCRCRAKFLISRSQLRGKNWLGWQSEWKRELPVVWKYLVAGLGQEGVDIDLVIFEEEGSWAAEAV